MWDISQIGRKCADIYDISQIHPVVVLAYLSAARRDCLETLYPKSIEQVPLWYAITYRNRFMLKNADFLIGYAANSFGNAAKYISMAKRMEQKGKITVIDLSTEIRR